MLRRLEKRILVDLPIESARKAMFLHHLPPVISTQPINITTTIDYDSVAKVTMSHDFQLIYKINGHVHNLYLIQTHTYTCIHTTSYKCTR